MSEIEQLQQAIVALEQQRAALGDVAVDAAIAGLRQKLHDLAGADLAALPAEQRKQVTILFADISGFTAMAEAMDAEEVTAAVNALWQRLDAIITAHGGTIDKHIGDAVMALWGVQAAREDDPEQAIRAALAMQSSGRWMLDVGEISRLPTSDIQIRVAVHTGPVLLGTVGTTGEFTAMGDAVNLASRLQNAAPVGSVIISYDTYRLVRGLFEVTTQEPLALKGKREPVQTYLVQRARPRAFHMATRGVEGIATRTVGREAELAALQEEYHLAMAGPARPQEEYRQSTSGPARLQEEYRQSTSDPARLQEEYRQSTSDPVRLQDEYRHAMSGPDRLQEEYRQTMTGTTRLVTLLGEAGVGKSRLLYEFEQWLDGLPEDIFYFQGRAIPEITHIPYSLLRDLFSHRFNILERDSLALVRAKFATGMAPYLDTDRAHLVGQLVGFDFSTTTAVRNLLGGPSFAALALADLTRYFRDFTAEHRTVILLDDLHWADNPSLDFILRLCSELADRPLLILCLARPVLSERRPDLGSAAARRLALSPLTPAASRALVGDILQKVEELPAGLSDVIVRSAEGNPFYVEELVKMLIDDGVIVPGPERWQVEMERLQGVRVPPTLTGVLQARLDVLPAGEKDVLQRAAVVGRTFWDAAVEELYVQEEQGQVALVGPALETLEHRELIFQQEGSAFAGTREFLFKHILLRDVTYEMVLRRLRRVYHRQAAEWLERHGGERLNEYAGVIAEHYEQAGDTKQAVAWLHRAGDSAFDAGAIAEAQAILERALALAPEEDRLERAGLLISLGHVEEQVSDYAAAAGHMQAAWELAREIGNAKVAVQAMGGLSRVAVRLGHYRQARELSDQSLAQARATGDPSSCAVALDWLGVACYYERDLDAAARCTEEAMELYRQVGDHRGVASCLNGLGMIADNRGDYVAATGYYEDSMAIAREIGDRWTIKRTLINLGWATLWRGDYATAIQYTEESLGLCRETGDRHGAAICLGNLGHAYAGQGNAARATDYYRQALAETMAIGAVPLSLEILAGLAGLWVKESRPTEAAELLGLALGHPASNDDVVETAGPVLAALRTALPAEEVEAAMERGKGLELAGVVVRLLG